MYATFISLWIQSVLLTSLHAAPVERPPVVLFQGEQKILRVPGLARYSLGSDHTRVHRLPAGISEEPGSSESLLIKGIRPGFSDLWIWKSDGSSEHRSLQIQASPKESQKSLELTTALSKLTECEIQHTGKGVILRGQIQTLNESAQVTALVRNYPDEIKDETELADPLLEMGQTRIRDWVQESSLSNSVRVERHGKDIWVRGAVTDISERKRLERQLRILFPAVELELNSLPDNAPTVHFKVFLLELKRNRFGSLGLDWPTDIPGAFRVAPWSIKTALDLDLTLRALEGDGSARVLSNPELVVRAPGEAELFAGGEIPIKIKTKTSYSIQWKTYGLTLRLKVTHVAGENIRLDIFTEVSQLDLSTAVDEIPGLHSNRMNTQVDANFGRPLFLSGLLQQDVREQARGLPLLREIPVLGRLFSSEDFLNQKSELVAILVPSSTPPPSREPITPHAELKAELRAELRGELKRKPAESAASVAPPILRPIPVYVRKEFKR